VAGCAVYEWEADGEGSCESEEQNGGCLFLISGGTGSESYFLDASGSGGDVFFFSRDKLVGQDSGESIVVYDAHACEPGECPGLKALGAGPCSGEACLNPGRPSPAPGILASLTLTGTGNLAPPAPTGPASTKPTAAQERARKLAKALKACKRAKRHKKRTSCERAARAKYAVHASRTSRSRG